MKTKKKKSDKKLIKYLRKQGFPSFAKLLIYEKK